jgi:DNA-binding beta-propeller fold protein YncE
VFFKPDGTKMYVVDGTSFASAIYEYSLSTAWDITSASYTSASYATETEATSSEGVFFRSNGLSFFVISRSSQTVYEYSLSTAWDLSTASYTGISYSHVSASGESTSYGVFFKPDGTKMYVSGNATDSVHQFSTTLTTATLDLSTGSVFEITPTSDIQINLSNPADSGTVSQATLLLDGAAASSYDIANASHYGNMSVSTQLTSPNGMEISSDGTKIYVVGRTTDKVFEYVLSTPWDVTTGSYNSVEFSVLSQTTYPTDIAFKPDGTKMYICTSAEDAVFQYSLSTAWDLSTASYDSVSFDTSNEENNVQALAFSNDGTKMYTAGLEFDNVVEYDLSTAWDVSTASHNSVTLSTSSQTTTPDGLFFNADGTSLFVISSALDQVLQYDMTTAFDLSTASYTLASSSLNLNANTGKGGRFDNTGTRMYIVDNGADNVTQWTVGSAATITYPSTLEWPSGTAPTSPAYGETDVLTFTTSDGGTSYQAVQAIDGAS